MMIGTLLRKLRDSKRFTTREIAYRVGVGLSTYIDWEHDKSSPSLRLYSNLADAFEICPIKFMSYLIGKADNVNKLSHDSSIEYPREIIIELAETNKMLIISNQQFITELSELKQLLAEVVKSR